ncbi:DUF397 domain-containing protein [Streptomyces sp. NPDC001407]|uniref:DUF397 domain-containing protein n=1 Tax=Streptomyces sp. NPDC001407 TaxID=3364573 RepID=UPI0036A0C99D
MKEQEIVTEFRKATASQPGANECVEVAGTADGGRAIRHSKAPDGPKLFYTKAEWAAFLDGAKKGEFDEP